MRLVLALLLVGIAPGALPQAVAQPAAQEVPPPPAPPPPVFEAPVTADTLRSAPPPPALDAYRADPDFQYDDPRAEGPSLWDRLVAWVVRKFWGPIAENTTATFWEWVAIAVAVGALGWAASRLLRAGGGGGVFGRRERGRATVGPLLDVDDIAEVDLGSRLVAALAEGDHREAVRVRYLALLQALDAAGLVAWRRDKTNRQYVAEVAAADPARARPFRRATRAFDAVWYGERPVSQALYARLAPVFDRAEPEPSVPA